MRRRFFAPGCAGPLPPVAGASRHRGEAGGVARGAWVRIEVAVRAGAIECGAFQAWGCPYLIAACDRSCEQLHGALVQRLLDMEPAALMAEFDVPVERLGSLLVLQDALRNCFADWDTTQPAGTR